MRIQIEKYYCPRCKSFTNNVHRSYVYKKNCVGTFYCHDECGTPVKEVRPIIERLLKHYVEDSVQKREQKDLVDVVRCKNCLHGSWCEDVLRCTIPDKLYTITYRPVTENDFCSKGIRKKYE